MGRARLRLVRAMMQQHTRDYALIAMPCAVKLLFREDEDDNVFFTQREDADIMLMIIILCCCSAPTPRQNTIESLYFCSRWVGHDDDLL